MPAAEALARLREALSHAVRRSGRSLPDLSQRLGRIPQHLELALAGRRALRLAEVFRLLALLGEEPHEFFDACFPLGGEAEREFRRRNPDPAGEARLRELLEAAAAEQAEPPPTPKELSFRATRLLCAYLRAGHCTQERASRALGLGPSALGQVLQGKTAFRCEYLLGTLALLDVSPARFFAELLGPADREVLPRVRWSQLVATVDRLVAGSFAEVARRSASSSSTTRAMDWAVARKSSAER
jgi:transcriptional regulator with XRE-family HTH domain